MKYEIERAEAMEVMEEQEIQQNLEMNPPKLEATSKKEEMPPKMEKGATLGESLDAGYKRRALERAIERGNSTQIKNRGAEYKAQIVKDALK